MTPRSSTPVKSNLQAEEEEPHKPTKHVENATKGLRVIFSDGTVIWNSQAIVTFIETLRKIGLSRIPEIGIVHSGYNLVSKEKREPVPGRIWQHESDGWYIYSNMSNSIMFRWIIRIKRYRTNF